VKVVRPHITLLVLLAVGGMCAVAMVFFPEQGIAVGNTTLRFKTWTQVWDTTSKAGMIDVDMYLESLDSAATDSVVVDTLAHLSIVRRQGITSLQFRDESSRPLFSFFESLHLAREEGRPMHVIHYGDSQIESDRITSFLRQKWQSEFGGGGPGLLSPVSIADIPSAKIATSDNWKRYTAFGFDQAKSEHNAYGILASFGRFGDDNDMLGDTINAWLEVRPSNLAQPLCRNFTRAGLIVKCTTSGAVIHTYVADSLVRTDMVSPEQGTVLIEHDFGFTPSMVRFVFKALKSPDVHAMLLEAGTGVNVDNVAMRGCDGNIFRRIQSQSVTAIQERLNVEMVILQYGGNAMPYIDTDKEAANYGSFFQSQIAYLKSWYPRAAFVVIGPSDMSTTVNGNYQTWPMLETVRDALKQAAFAENCAFWDMYEVMGGYNSMISWVSHDPPYAATDYTHFTPLGARKMAELLYAAILQEYTAWLTAVNERQAAEPTKNPAN
jgi:lysophospholipase L1-like esterase